MSQSQPQYLCPPMQLSPDLCAKLKGYKLDLYPSTIIERNLMFRGPVKFWPQNHLISTQIDSYSYIANSSIVRTAKIGRYCSIAHNVEISLLQHSTDTLSSSAAFEFGNAFTYHSGPIKRLPPIARQYQETSEPVTIGHDVWIGAHVCIVKGVTIGTGAIIGTGSIITHDVPPYAVVAGAGGGENSKDIIKRYRFSDEVIADLLELKWWDYDLPKLMSGMQIQQQHLPFNNVKDFIAFMRDSDTSTWPKLPAQWLYLVPQDANTAQLIPVAEDFNMGHAYPQELLNDPTWD